MAKRKYKDRCGKYPRLNFTPFIVETVVKRSSSEVANSEAPTSSNQEVAKSKSRMAEGVKNQTISKKVTFDQLAE